MDVKIVTLFAWLRRFSRFPYPGQDVANRADEKEHVDFTPSHNLKDTKKMFEGGTAVAPSK